MANIQILVEGLFSPKCYWLRVLTHFSVLVVVGLEKKGHMLWTFEIEARIDFVGWRKSMKNLPGKSKKGECRLRHNVAWGYPVDFPLGEVKQNLWKRSSCMIWKISDLEVNRFNSCFCLWLWLSTYRYVFLDFSFSSSQMKHPKWSECVSLKVMCWNPNPHRGWY